MGDSNPNPSSTPPVKGWESLKKHCLEDKINFAIWVTRLIILVSLFTYFIPIIGSPHKAYHRALLAHAASSALRLHARMPRVQFNAVFLNQVLMEDSCHNLLYSIIFIYTTPVTLALLPVFLYTLVLFASHSLRMLDAYGQNSWWGARIFVSLIEFQSNNIFRLMAFLEIILMPFTVILVLIGRTGLLTPFFYYHFISRRYASRRNPYSRRVFRELRVYVENLASKPSTPEFARNLLNSGIAYVGQMAPAMQEQAQ